MNQLSDALGKLTIDTRGPMPDYGFSRQVKSVFSADCGVGVNGEFSFTSSKDGSNAKLKVIKEEAAVTYKLAIAYLGLSPNKLPNWEVRLNDLVPMYEDGNKMQYFGSNKMVFKIVDKSTIEIEETDEKVTGKSWIDLSGKFYTVSRERPEKQQIIGLL